MKTSLSPKIKSKQSKKLIRAIREIRGYIVCRGLRGLRGLKEMILNKMERIKTVNSALGF